MDIFFISTFLYQLLISLGTAGIVTTKKNHPGPVSFSFITLYILFFNIAERKIVIWVNQHGRHWCQRNGQRRNGFGVGFDFKVHSDIKQWSRDMKKEKGIMKWNNSDLKWGRRDVNWNRVDYKMTSLPTRFPIGCYILGELHTFGDVTWDWSISVEGAPISQSS